MKKLFCFVVVFLSMLCSCERDISESSELRRINLITSQMAHMLEGEEGLENCADVYGFEKGVTLMICCNDDELEFWRQKMTLSIDMISEVSFRFFLYDDVLGYEADISENQMKDMEFHIPLDTYDYRIILPSQFPEPGIYSFRFNIELAESGKRYHTQEFELTVHEGIFHDRIDPEITGIGYWTELREK